MRIPIRMWGPADAREALGLGPLVKAGGAHSPGVEGVPLIAAGARPVVALTGRPATQPAADPGARRIMRFLLLLEIVVQNDGGFYGVIREGTHVPVLCPNLVRRFSAVLERRATHH
jgi:hypothetical protein